MYMATAEALNKYIGDHKQFIQDRILNPVGMSSTTFSEVTAKRTGHFPSSWDDFSRGRQIPYWFPEPTAGFMSAAGGLISSANDMVNSPLSKGCLIRAEFQHRRSGSNWCSNRSRLTRNVPHPSFPQMYFKKLRRPEPLYRGHLNIRKCLSKVTEWDGSVNLTEVMM